MRLRKGRWADSLSLCACACVCLRRETWEASHNISAAKHRSPLSMLWRPAVVINNGNCAKLNPAGEPHARPGAIPRLAAEDASPRRELRPRSALLLRSNVLFSLTLAINPSNKRDSADKSCKISPRDTRIVRKVRMKVGEFRFRIWMFALFVLFSFSFFLERRSKVEDQKRFGTEDGKMLETNIVDFERFSYFFSCSKIRIKLPPTNGVENCD